MTGRRRPVRALAAMVPAVGVGAVVVAALGSTSSAGPAGSSRGSLPAGPKPAFRIPRPVPLAPTDETRWAPVEQATVARASPGGRAIARVGAATPEGTANLLVVEGRARRAAGALWVRVRLAVLPNNSVGWVPRKALGGYRTVDTRLVVDRSRLTAELFRGTRRIFSAPVGIGKPQWPTPSGRFYVRVKLTRYRNAFYGPRAFGTSARSAVLTDWPGGGFVGIHGTNEPQLLPGRVSHGCIRMTNAAILRLDAIMPVGTPVTVV